MAYDFANAVEDGLKLSKRIYFGEDRAVTPPKLPHMMGKSADAHLPTAPMVYAVISDPRIVDNPDLPSYQPHVHGRCDPPALIPLQMNEVELEADCYLDTAVIRVTGSWRVHCVMGSRSCDCRIAIPMGDQGSILGLEVDIPRKSYHTQLVAMEDIQDAEKITQFEDASFLKPHIFTLTVPQVDGGSVLNIKVSWSQELSYSNGQLSLNVPFTFPDYVNPVAKKFEKKERIQLNVKAGPRTEIICNANSHPLKGLKRQGGKLSFVYESLVLSWSRNDFSFSYSIASSNVSGGVLLQSPSEHDTDQRDMFCIYLIPETQQTRKVLRKGIVFLVDISKSMQGQPLDEVKIALSLALSKLDPEDLFNIIAFNGETSLFSTSMETATEETVKKATEWIRTTFIADGGTNISLPMNKAIEMLSKPDNMVPIIFLVTDGAVEDERHICDQMKKLLTHGGPISPRIYTLGIGLFCNHYFLRMLAAIGRGQYDGAYDIDSIALRMEKLFGMASSINLMNINFDTLEDLDDLEVYPSFIPDLSSESLLIVSGRYRGNFPDTLKAKGLFTDLSSCVIDLKVEQSEDVSLKKALAKAQIDQLTALAWLSQNKQLEKKVAKMSIETGVLSEFTQMIILETSDKPIKLAGEQKASTKGYNPIIVEPKEEKKILQQFLGIGFGNLPLTSENIHPGFIEPKLPDAAEKFVLAASNCCGRLCTHCCCPCCIQACSRINNECATVLMQLCTALACFACVECCADVCCGKSDGM